MQLATVRDNKPWICSVYYVADDEQQRLYWLSKPERRHSQEIAQNSQIAVAIAVKADKPVIGIQAEGKATEVKDAETVKAVMQRYIDKYGEGKDFYNNFVDGTNQHSLYCFTPERYVLFDEINYPGGVGQEWRPE